MAPTAPPKLQKSDDVKRSDQTIQMVSVTRENTPKSKVTAVRADLPASNLSVAILHLGSRVCGPKINK